MQDPSLEQKLRELVDRQAIHDVILRYCRGVDRMDRELLLSAYHPDAIDDHGLFVGGPEAFADYFLAFHQSQQSATQHIITNHSCELDGDTAHCETYWLFAAMNREGPGAVPRRRPLHRSHGTPRRSLGDRAAQMSLRLAGCSRRLRPHTRSADGHARRRTRDARPQRPVLRAPAPRRPETGRTTASGLKWRARTQARRFGQRGSSRGRANAISASPGSDQTWPPDAITMYWRPLGPRR